MALGFAVLLVLGLPFSGGAADRKRTPARGAPSTRTVATALSSVHVHQLFRATTNVFSGNSPETDVAFAEIAKLGVKTIISVDGAKPEVELARKHGMRYIHLPVGYDGVPTNRQAELVQAALASPGPLYVHCHHGKHRGPAAVAVICEGTAGWTTNQAVTWLKEAGTAPDYAGLYRSVLEFRRPDAATLARIGTLPERAATPAVVDAMVAIDEQFDRLKAARTSDWKANPAQPSSGPAQTATLLWEQFRELRRTDDTAGRPADYHAKLAASEEAADRFRSLLRDRGATAAQRETAFRALGQSCVDCHKRYRN